MRIPSGLVGQQTFKKRIHETEFFPETAYSWYDASDVSTVSETGGLVSQWNDKTARGNHLVVTGSNPAVTGSLTQNSLNVLSFGQSGWYTSTTVALPSDNQTVVAVVKSDVSDGFRRWMSLYNSGQIVDYSNAASWVPAVFANTGNQFFTYNANSAKWYSAVVDLTDTYIITAKYVSGGACEIRLNGAVSGSIFNGGVSGLDVDRFVVGGGYPSVANESWIGWIGEILIFDHELDDEVTVQVETYLNDKWNVF